MADALQSDERQQPLQVPSDRQEMIKRGMREVTQLEAERKRIGKEIASVKQRLIKGALGWKLKDWSILGRLYNLEHEDRDETLRTLKEGFAALEIGEQLDWVAATGAENEAGEAAANGGAAAGFTAEMGRDAGLAGKNRDSNPHLEGSKAFEAWDAGWLEGQTELARGLGEGESPKRGRGRPRRTAAADLLN